MSEMSPVEAIFFAALEKTSPQERASYVAHACGDDANLRNRVERLLAAHPHVGNFLEQPAVAPADTVSASSQDADRSDPSLPANGDVLKALIGSIGSVPRVHLREAQDELLTPVVRPGSTEVPPGQDPVGRYRIDGEIARGGMGAILKGRDTDLGRDIAVKVLLETHQGKTELAQRFVEEAQIAGQLQHPGVVPVYELGVFSDRRPYFTMKLVKGKTLAVLLAARNNVGDDRAKVVGIFAQVCQTLAYAHARGVIHRDLKPSNVMVGNFGEVQVMDWGLAKVLHEGGVADETRQERQRPEAVSVIRTQRSAGSGTTEVGSKTHAGSVLGTPAYMAPEQARGEVNLVDERADVFGLGALLCEILTGEPPFLGKKADAMRKSQTAQLDDAHARLDGCGADAELVGLANRCLAAEPWDRPRDAGKVAEEMTAYQNSVAERLRQAELARAAAEVKTVEERKRRRLTLALASSVLAVAVVGAVGGIWVQRLRAQRGADAARRDMEQRQAVESALEKVAALQKAARWKEAEAVLGQAGERLDDSDPADLVERVKQSHADMALVARLDSIRQKRADIMVNGKFDDRTADQEYAAAFREVGLAEDGEEAKTVAARVHDSAVWEQLVAALDDWAIVTVDSKRQVWLLEVARRADADPRRARFRDPDVRRDRAELEALAAELLRDEVQLAHQKPHLLAALGSALRRTNADPVPLLAAAQVRHPDDFWLNIDLGNALVTAKQLNEAAGYFRVALALRPMSSGAHNNLGGALLHNKQQLDDAIREFRTAIELDPNYATAHNNLGIAFYNKKQLDKAFSEFRTAIELDQKLVAAHNSLGIALYDKKQLDEAIREFRTAIELDPKCATAHSSLGTALRGKNQLDEAIREYRIAIESDPKDAEPHYNLGNLLVGNGQVDEAIKEYRTVIGLQPDFAEAHCNLGGALERQGKFAEALTERRIGHELGSKRPGWRYPSAAWVREAEYLVQLEARLPEMLAGKDKPANDTERLQLARMCQEHKKLYAASARYFGEAFDHDSKLATDMRQPHRYNAACVSALAGCGQGNDTAKLDDKERSRLRNQALDWLQADLAHWSKQAGSEKLNERALVQPMLEHWLDDADLAGIRDMDAVAKLPADEQEACKKLWAEVEAVLKKVQEKPM
jgi:serine/threonine-protein kinase